MACTALQLESRLQVRRAIRGPAGLVMNNGNYIPVRLFDISEGGVCVISQMNLRNGLSCRLSTSILLAPPTPTLLKHKVEIRYNVYSYSDGGFRIGLRFDELDNTVAEAIRKYISAPRYTRSVTSI